MTAIISCWMKTSWKYCLLDQEQIFWKGGFHEGWPAGCPWMTFQCGFSMSSYGNLSVRSSFQGNIDHKKELQLAIKNVASNMKKPSANIKKHIKVQSSGLKSIQLQKLTWRKYRAAEDGRLVGSAAWEQKRRFFVMGHRSLYVSEQGHSLGDLKYQPC